MRNNKHIILKELESQNTKLLSENQELKEKLNSRFNDQQTRVESIIEIAKYEHKNIYDDIIGLINDKKRFNLDNLLSYSPSEWLIKRNYTWDGNYFAKNVIRNT